MLYHVPSLFFKQQIDQETVSYSRISSIWNHFFWEEKWALLLFTFSLVFVQRASNQVLAFAKKENIRRLRLLPPYFLPSSSNTQTFLFMALNHGLFKSFTILSSLRRFLYPTFTLQIHIFWKNPNEKSKTNCLFCVNLLKT